MQFLSTLLRCSLAIICAALLPACGGGGDNPGPASYTLRNMAVGETRLIPEERLSIEMTSVSDSRCPATALCITSGFASVNLLVRLDGGTAQALTPTLGLGAHDGDAIFGNFQFLLDRLDPFPISGHSPQNQYRADITVRRR